MAKKQHVHKYYRLTNYVKLWACALEDCTHVMPKHLEEMMMGKKSICWECGSPFKLNSFSLKMDKPMCEQCNPELNTPEAIKIREMLKSQGLV